MTDDRAAGRRAQGKDWLVAVVTVAVFVATGEVVRQVIDPLWLAAIVAITAILAEGIAISVILLRRQRTTKRTTSERP